MQKAVVHYLAKAYANWLSLEVQDGKDSITVEAYCGQAKLPIIINRLVLVHCPIQLQTKIPELKTDMMMHKTHFCLSAWSLDSYLITFVLIARAIFKVRLNLSKYIFRSLPVQVVTFDYRLFSFFIH